MTPARVKLLAAAAAAAACMLQSEKNLEMENLLQVLNQHGLDNRSLKATENRASKIMYSEQLVNQKTSNLVKQFDGWPVKAYQRFHKQDM